MAPSAASLAPYPPPPKRPCPTSYRSPRLLFGYSTRTRTSTSIIAIITIIIIIITTTKLSGLSYFPSDYHYSVFACLCSTLSIALSLLSSLQFLFSLLSGLGTSHPPDSFITPCQILQILLHSHINIYSCLLSKSHTWTVTSVQCHNIRPSWSRKLFRFPWSVVTRKGSPTS